MINKNLGKNMEQPFSLYSSQPLTWSFGELPVLFGVDVNPADSISSPYGDSEQGSLQGRDVEYLPATERNSPSTESSSEFVPAKKRGRKRKSSLPHSSALAEAKKAARKEKNKLSAKKSRQAAKERLEALTHEVQELNHEKAAWLREKMELQKERWLMAQELDLLRRDNAVMRVLIQTQTPIPEPLSPLSPSDLA
jgi:hypothetical protein